MANSLLKLAYVSSAVRPFSPAELELLLLEARERNRANGVTGALLYSDGNFMQVLEGTPEAVDATFARVNASRRHHGVIELYREASTVREFPDWQMGFRELDPEVYAPLRQEIARESGAAHALLSSFWRDF